MTRLLPRLPKSNKDLKKENEFLHNEFSRVNNENIKIREAQDELEQYGRRDCLEVRGIPQTESENTNDIIFQIASNIDVKIDHENISTSHRLPGSGPTTKFHPSIVVKFTRWDVRDKFFAARYKQKHLTTRDLGYTRSASSKYIWLKV